MRTKVPAIEKIVEEQIQRWQLIRDRKEEGKPPLPVVTVSREPGSGGRIIAERLANKLGVDLFHQEVIHEMAASADVSERFVETLDERGMNVLEEWIASLVDSRHLWPDRYLRHLLKVIGTIGRHGGAVMVGRGANFLLPPERRFRVRMIAPVEQRIQHVAETYGTSAEETRRRLIRTESDRKAFIRKYFNANIADPLNYDLIINTGTIGIDAAVDAIVSAMGR